MRWLTFLTLDILDKNCDLHALLAVLMPNILLVMYITSLDFDDLTVRGFKIRPANQNTFSLPHKFVISPPKSGYSLIKTN